MGSVIETASRHQKRRGRAPYTQDGLKYPMNHFDEGDDHAVTKVLMSFFGFSALYKTENWLNQFQKNVKETAEIDRGIIQAVPS